MFRYRNFLIREKPMKLAASCLLLASNLMQVASLNSVWQETAVLKQTALDMWFHSVSCPSTAQKHKPSLAQLKCETGIKILHICSTQKV